ncbi:MAG: hypothetical protein HC897_09420 [Thermoanaerobaculia bacterium]|nr:hypothetical protein [Thermoanaerobaculia bacterium]
MSSWILSIVPVTINDKNKTPVLMHFWGWGPAGSATTVLTTYPPVMKAADVVQVTMETQNKSVQDLDNLCTVVDLDKLTDKKANLVTQPSGSGVKVPGLDGESTCSGGQWWWVSTGLTAGTHYQFSMDVTINGITYKADPEMYVASDPGGPHG